MKRELLECLDMMKRIGAMNECVYDRILLNEGAGANSRKNAINLYMDKTDCKNPEYAKLFVNNTLRAKVTSLRNNKCAKFTLGVTRLYLDGQLNFGDNVTINKLNKLIYFLAKREDIVINSNFDGMNLQQLFDKFYNDTVTSKRNTNIQTQDTPNGGYRIVRIANFEEASQYAGYTDWCITYHDSYYANETSGGMGIFYFCLRNGFADIEEPEEPGENAPLDDYGLSMLAVCVDAEGNYKSCTCRWNHDNGGTGSVLDVEEISDLIGKNFYDVFKPRFTEWQIKDKKGEIIARFGSKVEGIDIIKNGLGQCNYINEEGELLSPKMWFSDCDKFSEGFALVSFGGKYNFIRPNGQFLSPHVWFDYANHFENGLALIHINGKHNYLTKEGDFLSTVWFNYAGDFEDGFALVRVKDKGYNFLDQNGNPLSPVWFDNVYDFKNGFARVYDKGKGWNYIDRNGNLLSNDYFEEAFYFDESGYAKVTLRGEDGKIDTKGNFYPQES